MFVFAMNATIVTSFIFIWGAFCDILISRSFLYLDILYISGPPF
jgi:hypothetical protein